MTTETTELLERLKELEEEKNELFNRCLPQAVKLDVIVDDGVTIYKNKYLDYLIESEEIDKEITSIKNKLRAIEWEEKKM